MLKIYRYLAGIAGLAAAIAIPVSVSAQTTSHAAVYKKANIQKTFSLHTSVSKSAMKFNRPIMGSVTAVSGTTLTVTGKNSTSTVYTVDASTAKIQDGFTIANIMTGDHVIVMGSTSGTQVTAKSIQDLSFLGRNLFQGTVASVSSSTITITTPATKMTSSTTYTVDASSATLTKLMGMKSATSTSMTIADIQVGDHLTVIGSLSGSTVTATSVRDAGQPGMLGKRGGGTCSKLFGHK